MIFLVLLIKQEMETQQIGNVCMYYCALARLSRSVSMNTTKTTKTCQLLVKSE